MSIEEHLQQNRLLSDLTTFGIGGPARYYFEAKTVPDIQEAFAWANAQGLRVCLLGKGSNSLYSSEGFDGLVIHNRIDHYSIVDTLVTVGAGASFSLLGARTARLGLTGLEFASGIPASVGGAIYMNAGANGHETCEKLASVDVVDESGMLRTFAKEELEFSYRTSSFQKMGGCICGAVFVLDRHAAARNKQLEIVNYRLNTQPTLEKSAGCVFRNPPGAFSAGALIERCGLKGMCIGGAKVSEKHANFIVNTGGARDSDVLQLIEKIQQTVFEATGVHLEPEVRMIL